MTCPDCGEEMSDDNTDTCSRAFLTDGVLRLTKHFNEPSGRCHDCNILHGGYHHAGCDVERCPICRNQLISCEHGEWLDSHPAYPRTPLPVSVPSGPGYMLAKSNARAEI